MNGNHPDRQKESPEKEEPSIYLLQWYLKMVIDVEPEKKINKRRPEIFY
jgi:hypothetical protein